MTLDGGPFLGLVVAVTIAGILVAAVWLPRTRRTVRGFFARVATILGTATLVLLCAGVVLDDQFQFFADWGDLVGSGSGQTSASAGGSPQQALDHAVAGSDRAPAPATLPALPSPGQRDQVFTVKGAGSGLTGKVVVSLPVGYGGPANARRTYPVIEAFHGYPGTPEVWTQGVELVPTLDASAAAHQMPGVIVIAPQWQFPQGRDTECVNGSAGQPAVDTFVSQDVPDFVAAHLRVDRSRTAWATVGFSTGGYCAAVAAMLHPAIFGAAISLGGYLTPDFGPTYVPFHVGSRLWHRYDLVALAKSAPPPVAMWVETSKVDGLSYSTSMALIDSARAPLSVQAHVEQDAGHRMSVWADAMPAALQWLAADVPGFGSQAAAVPGVGSQVALQR